MHVLVQDKVKSQKDYADRFGGKFKAKTGTMV